jgi:hypothetical protein
MENKSITLSPGHVPQFVGQWTLGEIRQMAQSLIMWLDAIPITKPEDVKISEDKQS